LHGSRRTVPLLPAFKTPPEACGEINSPDEAGMGGLKEKYIFCKDNSACDPWQLILELKVWPLAGKG